MLLGMARYGQMCKICLNIVYIVKYGQIQPDSQMAIYGQIVRYGQIWLYIARYCQTGMDCYARLIQVADTQDMATQGQILSEARAQTASTITPKYVKNGAKIRRKWSQNP